MRITNSSVTKTEPPENDFKIYWDDDLTGFGLRVTASGAKSYIAESRVDGRTRRVTLGKHGVLTANEARKRARTMLGQMADGVDPVAAQRRQRAVSVTLTEVAKSYLCYRRTSSGLPLKERSKADIRYHLSTSLAPWQHRPVVNITREQVQRCYAALAERGVAQANQAMRILSSLLNYASSAYRTPEGERIISDNPAAVLRETNTLRAVQPKSTRVPIERLGEWWSAVQALRTDPGLSTASRSAADLIALLTLTGLRLGEARAIRWSDVDVERFTLTLVDTKNRTDVVLPLSDIALRIIKARPTGSSYIFSPRSKRSKLPHLKDCRRELDLLDKQTGIVVTAHDLRRTFRSVAAACNIELWRCKALMNHKQNDDVTLAHYTELSDVSNLKPETNRISQFFEEQRLIFEAGNVQSISSRSA